MRIRFSAIVLAVSMMATGVSFLFSSSVHAGSTGMASIHPLTYHGNKLCMIGHYHYGADSSTRSKAQALANAKRNWADFVILEYGSDWGRFSNSANKGVKCTGSKSDGYHCSISSSPCKASGRRAITKTKVQKRRYTKKRHYTKARYKKRKSTIRLSIKRRWKKRRR